LAWLFDHGFKKTRFSARFGYCWKDSVAVRFLEATLALLESLDFPLAAPSANPFGSISPTTAFHVVDYFGDKLQMVLDGGDCQNGIESTIIGFENEDAVLYRVGSISIEDIEVYGKIKIKNKKKTHQMHQECYQSIMHRRPTFKVM
jgi:L-threonylcarbamoyladenylate synthase